MAKRKSKSKPAKADPFRIGPEYKPVSEPVPEPPPFPQTVEGILIDGQEEQDIVSAIEDDCRLEQIEAAMEPDFYVDIGEPGFPCIIRIF